MLEAVGMPHVVNPDSGLREIAIERGWPVLTFEKPEALRRPIIDDPEQRKKAVMTVGTIAVFVAWYFKRRAKRNRSV
jgi:hypothetical protein